jgi:hypothetical protein
MPRNKKKKKLVRVEEYAHKNYVQQITTPYIGEGRRELPVRPTPFADFIIIMMFMKG